MLMIRSVRRAVAAATLTTLGIAATSAASAAAAQEAGIAVGTMAPAAALTTLDGKAVDLKDYVAHGPVLLEFWATWCPLCRKLEPAMHAAQAKYPQVRFVSVGVPQNQSTDRQQAYVEKQQLKGDFLFDRDGAAIAAYHVPHTSYVVVVDALGKVVYTGVGPEQDIDAAIAKALPVDGKAARITKDRPVQDRGTR